MLRIIFEDIIICLLINHPLLFDTVRDQYTEYLTRDRNFNDRLPEQFEVNLSSAKISIEVVIYIVTFNFRYYMSL